MSGEDLVLRFIGLDLLSNVAAAIGNKVDSLMRSIGSSGNELGKSFANVGKIAIGMGAGLLALSAGFAAVTIGAGAAAGKFEQHMTMIHTQAGASTAEVERMTQAVLDIAPAVGFGPEKLADALYHVESLGFRGKEALNVLEIAAKGAQIGNASLTDTVNALGGALVAQVGGVKNASEAMAVFDATIGVGNMRMQDLVSALSTGIIPAGKNFGLTLQEIGGALATLTDNAVPADEAATRLRMTFALIGAPTRQATKELATIGISQLQLAHDMRGPNGLVVALRDLHDHLTRSGKSAEEQSFIITRAFGGGRSSAGIMTLLNNLDRLDQRTRQITAMTGSFGERFAERAKNMTFAAEQLKATFEVLVIVIGTAVLPVLDHIMIAMTPIITAISNWIRQHQQLTAALLIGAIVFTALAGIFLLVFGTIALVLGGILALVAAAPLIGAAIVPTLVAIGVTLAVMAALVIAIFAVVKAIENWARIRAIAEAVWGFIGPYVMGVVNGIRDAIDEFVTLVGRWWQAHGEQVGQVWSGIVAAVRGAWEVISAIVRFEIGLLLPFIQAFFSLIGDAARLAFDLIVSVVRIAWDVISSIFAVELDLLTGHWQRAWDDLRDGLGQIFEDIVNAAQTFGEDLTNGIINGITNVGGGIANAIGKFIPGPVKKFLGIGNDMGRDVATGMAAGLDANSDTLDRAAERAGARLAPPMTTVVAPVPRQRGDFDRAPSAAPVRMPTPDQSGLVRAWEAVRGYLSRTWASITREWDREVSSLNRIWQRFASDPVYWVGYMVGRVVGAVMRMNMDINRSIAQARANMTAAFEAFGTMVGDFMGRLPRMIGDALWNTEVAVARFAARIRDWGVNTGSSFVNAISSFFSQLPGRVGGFLAATLTGVVIWAGQMRDAAGRSAQQLVDFYLTILRQLPQEAYKIGQSIVHGIIQGILDLKDWAGRMVGDFVRGLIKGGQDAGKGGSPMMLFAEEIGRPIVQGAVVGIEEETPRAVAAMDQLLNAMVPATRGTAVHAHAGGTFGPAAIGEAPAISISVGAPAAAASQMSMPNFDEIERYLAAIASDMAAIRRGNRGGGRAMVVSKLG